MGELTAARGKPSMAGESEDNAIEAMGFHEGADKNGVRFVCTW